MNVTSETKSVDFRFALASELHDFHDWYKDYHGYLAAAVCTLGCVANALNIIVLSQKTMCSATNCILTGLAISDGLTMLAYLPFALRFYVLYGTEMTPERNSLPAVRFLLFYACFSVVVHTVSIWLTVTLATFRYLLVERPSAAVVRLCSVERAKATVLLVYAVSIVVCVPNFTTIDVQSDVFRAFDAALNDSASAADEEIVLWTVRFKQKTNAERFVYSLNFWIQATLVKLLPCVGLTFLSILLVRTMKRADARRMTLRLSSVRSSMAHRGSCSSNSRETVPRMVLTNRTTRMLLVVVLLFLVTELPQGIVNLLSGIFHDFAEEIYLNLGDLIDILALTNNGINFILYCTMSKQFRDTFVQVFRLRQTSIQRRPTLIL